MDRRTFIKRLQLLGLPLLSGAAATFFISNTATASDDTLSPDITEKTRDHGETAPFRVSIIGAGGLGVRLVSQLSKTPFRNDPHEVSTNYFAVDTDRRSLDSLESTLVCPVWIPNESGVGGPCLRASTARRLATQHSKYLFGEASSHHDGIHNSGQLDLAGTAMTIIVAGFGRGAGTGLTQEIARKSKESGAFTAVFLTQPLSFEIMNGSPENELSDLAATANTVFTFRHDESRSEAPIATILSEAEMNLERQVRTLVNSVSGSDFVGMDFEDIRTLFTIPGIAGHGSGRGKVPETAGMSCSTSGDAVTDALRMLPNIESAEAALVVLSVPKDFKLAQYRDCMKAIRVKTSAHALIMGIANVDVTLQAGQFALDIWVPNYHKL